MKKIIFYIFVCFCFSLKVSAEELSTSAKSAILLDFKTGTVLYEYNADERLAPASMTKIASMLIIMEYVDEGKISLSDNVTISENAASMGGSQVFLEAGEVYTVDSLLKGVAVASGNDAVVALAEYVAGSEEEFVHLMNEKALKLGCSNTNFVNAHGLDMEGHYSSARDMAILARELLHHETILNYTSIYEEYLEKNDGSRTWLVNTNKLVRFYDGVDGLKTGYTSGAGYCITTTALRDNFRLISVVMGEESSEQRSKDTTELLNYGFNNYKLNTIKSSSEILGKVRVEGGEVTEAQLVLKEDLVEVLKTSKDTEQYSFNINVSTIKAPVLKGDTVGTMEVIDSNGYIIDEVDITVSDDITKANIVDYILRNIKTISVGKVLIKQ